MNHLFLAQTHEDLDFPVSFFAYITQMELWSDKFVIFISPWHKFLGNVLFLNHEELTALNLNGINH